MRAAPESFWLVRLVVNDPDAMLFVRAGEGPIAWTKDIDKAERFPTKTTADRFILNRLTRLARSCHYTKG